MTKNMPKSILGPYKKFSVREIAEKNTKYLKNQTILKIGKIGLEVKAIYSLCKMVSLGQKLKLLKNMPNTVLGPRTKCSLQKTAAKNTKYLKNHTILKIGKIGHEVKAVVFSK